MASLFVLIVIASIFIPTLFAVGFLWLYKKWRDRDGRRSPIEHKTIFGAGEQLRKRVEDHADAMLSSLTVLFFLGPYFLAAWALPKLNWDRVRMGFGEWLFVAAFLLMAAWAVHRIIHHGNRRRHYYRHRSTSYSAVSERGITTPEATPLGGKTADQLQSSLHFLQRFIIKMKIAMNSLRQEVRYDPATECEDITQRAFARNYLSGLEGSPILFEFTGGD